MKDLQITPSYSDESGITKEILGKELKMSGWFLKHGIPPMRDQEIVGWARKRNIIL